MPSRLLVRPLVACLFILPTAVVAAAAAGPATRKVDPAKPAVTLTGGHDIARDDFGRPIPLIAAALGVKDEVFREAFSGVTPSRDGPPSRDEARKNKAALLKVLAPHGVTNERLDEVSNYYRFQPQKGQLWPTTPAKAHAVVKDGKIQKVVIDEPGAGYSTPPKVAVEGFDGFEFKVTLATGKNLKSNGGVKAIEVVGTKEK